MIESGVEMLVAIQLTAMLIFGICVAITTLFHADDVSELSANLWGTFFFSSLVVAIVTTLIRIWS